MARKSNRDQMVDSIRKRLRDMAPENCETVEEAAANAALLAEMGLAAPSTINDFSSCSVCGRPCWHGVCQVCP